MLEISCEQLFNILRLGHFMYKVTWCLGIFDVQGDHNLFTSLQMDIKQNTEGIKTVYCV